MKKIFAFVAAVIAAAGGLCGIGYTIYEGAYIFAVGVAILLVFAFPKIKDCISYALS